MRIKDIVRSAPALQEFGSLAQAIKPQMTDPTVTRETRRAILNDLVNNLSEKTFQNGIIADQIMVIINKKEEVCKQHPNTESQVKEILSWCPRMEYHKDKLTKEIIKHRKQYKLAI